MLDQLVESKSNSGDNKRRSEFMLVTLVLAVSVVVFLWTRDLFAHDYDMGGDALSLTSLVAPVPVEDEPPPPEKKDKPQPADTRKEIVQNMMESPVKPPDKISNEKLTVPPRRLNMPTVQGQGNSDNPNAVPNRENVSEGDPNGLGGGNPGGGDNNGGAPDLPPPPPKATPKPQPKTVSGGVLNGKAISLPKPAYPAAARAVHAGGIVTVQVTIDETGRVVSASAAGGNALLQPAAVAAARGARFSPTLLSGQPVKVTGVITYNFTP